MKTKTWQEHRLENLNNLEAPENFKIPEGFYIPFGNAILIKEVKQGEMKTKGGIIMGQGAQKTIGASIGIIYAIGESINIPVKLGMKVYYEPTTLLRVIFDGEEYIQLTEHLVFGAVPPSTYLEPFVPDSTMLRREKRIDAQNKVQKRDKDNLEAKLNGN